MCVCITICGNDNNNECEHRWWSHRTSSNYEHTRTLIDTRRALGSSVSQFSLSFTFAMHSNLLHHIFFSFLSRSRYDDLFMTSHRYLPTSTMCIVIMIELLLNVPWFDYILSFIYFFFFPFEKHLKDMIFSQHLFFHRFFSVVVIAVVTEIECWLRKKGNYFKKKKRRRHTRRRSNYWYGDMICSYSVIGNEITPYTMKNEATTKKIMFFLFQNQYNGQWACVYLLQIVDLSFWRSSLFPTRWQIAQFFAQLNRTDHVIRTLTIVYGLIGGRLSLLCCSFKYIVCFEWCVHLIYVTMTAWIKFFWYSFWYCCWWRWWLLLLLWRLNLRDIAMQWISNKSKISILYSSLYT